jgi:hypothetical protein
MTVDRESKRLRRLEHKIDRLIWLCGIQTTVIVIVTAHYLLSQFPTFAVAVVVALPVLYLFRRALPGWTRRVSQMLGLVISGGASTSSKTQEGSQ